MLSEMCKVQYMVTSPTQPPKSALVEKEKTNIGICSFPQFELATIYGLPQRWAALLSLTFAVNSSIVVTSIRAFWVCSIALWAWHWLRTHQTALCLHAGSVYMAETQQLINLLRSHEKIWEARRTAAVTTLFVLTPNHSGSTTATWWRRLIKKWTSGK